MLTNHNIFLVINNLSCSRKAFLHLLIPSNYLFYYRSGGSGGTGGPDDRTSETKRVARSFRYMRKKPTIIAYQPPKGNLSYFYSIQSKVILIKPIFEPPTLTPY